MSPQCKGHLHDNEPCPRDVVSGSEYCIFHYPEKNEELANRFDKTLPKEIKIQESEHPDYLDFTEFDFPHEITGNIFQKKSNTLYFKLAVFRKDLIFYSDESKYTFKGGADFAYANFKGDTVFHYSTFGGYADFTGAIFEKDADFTDATFKGYAWFTDATFEDGADFIGANFKAGIDFIGTNLKEDTGFAGANIEGYTGFREATFERHARFEGARFKGDTGFANTNFKGGGNFVGIIIDGYARFDDTIFGDVEFNDTIFKGYAWFTGALYGKPNERNPIEAIWNAVFGLEDEVEELQAQVNTLQSQLDSLAPGKGFVSISPADFGTQYISCPYEIYIGSGPEYQILYAPLHLPQGVNLTRVGLYVYDGSPTHSCTLRIYKTTPLNQITWGLFYPNSFASVSSTDTSPEETYSLSTSIAEPTYYGYEIIDNTDGSYFLTLSIPHDQPLNFFSAFIEYEYPS
jgi:uncharacterized protein YjbI with pentapeptide repeats